MANPNVAFPITQQNIPNFNTNNGNGNSNSNSNSNVNGNSNSNTPAVVVTQSDEAVQASSSSNSNSGTGNNAAGASSEFTKNLEKTESQGKVELAGTETSVVDSKAAKQGARAAKQAAKAADKGGVTSAASEFTNALKKLESKGKIDLAGQDVDSLSKRLADAFSQKGINSRKLAKMVSKMLESVQGNSFANDIAKSADNQDKQREADKVDQTTDALAPKNMEIGRAHV